MRCVAVTVALFAFAACRSSAPYTVPAAAINTALGAGFAAKSRSEGGCYAVCMDGRTCNPATGLCEAAPPSAAATPGGCEGPLCLPAATGVARRPPAKAATGVGISPATGGVLTLPPTKPADAP